MFLARDLVEEGETAPQRAHALQQDAASGLGGLGAHEGGRLLGKLPAAGQRRRPHDAQGKQGHGAHGVGYVKLQQEGRQGVHGLEDGEEDERQHHKAQEVAHQAAARQAAPAYSTYLERIRLRE